ncbi:MAG: T9SS type A sorting domain-containing protein [Candidatus Marinimicrobia bacterium]|jgi:hypothetical protein|nr:T9SS type A sorting domain-containing protein [Candidatus Neomarinimicrobiota bacterium]
MKYLKFVLLSNALVLISSLVAQSIEPFQFVNPKPGSKMVSSETNIIMRSTGIIDRSTVSPELIQVTGSQSGQHTGELILTDDQKTLIFNPHHTFLENETVNVVMAGGFKAKTGSDIAEYAFNFRTAPLGIVQLRIDPYDDSSFLDDQYLESAQGIRDIATLPAPLITIDSIDNPAAGYIFMATWDRSVPAQYGNFVFVLDNEGSIVDSVRVNGAPYDFQIQPNGLLTYALGDFSSNVPLPGEELQHMVMDNSLAVIDSFKMKNGYITDFHEFKMLPNGHVMMMSYHTIIYDMSTVVEGGQTDASLVINIIQEQDSDKNVVFEWRNIDYIPITDSDLDLTSSRINYGTLNAFDIDTDGNILASFRNHSEIIKINKETGELMWRIGGPRGEFTFVGEHEVNAPYYHSRQHNIRRRPNGNITLFDNGQFHQPPYSRAVEYALDEVNHVATMVSEWRYPDGNIFCVTAGNAEPLTEGGWFIGYGVPSPQFVRRNAVEVHPDGSIALELSLPPNVLAYRAYKLPWDETAPSVSFTQFEVTQGNTYSFNNESIITGVEITYTALTAADYNEARITRNPYGPVQPEFIDNLITVSPVSITYSGLAIASQLAEFQIDLDVYPEIDNPENSTIYYRQFPDQGLFIPLTTSYDGNANTLSATLNGFGEIVFGIPNDDAENNAPILYEPLDQQKLIMQDSVTVRWTGVGNYNTFNVQISNDSTFASILEQSTTNLSDYFIFELTNNTNYYWRVASVLGSQASEWSDVWSFEITDPYISNVTPNGGEVWATENPEIIRWETNLLEDIRIELLEDQNFVFALDTLSGSRQAWEWIIPEDLGAGENYRIKIISIADSSIFGLSENVFTIIDSTTNVVDTYAVIPDGFVLQQNYPNPFNPSTSFRYGLPNAANVRLIIYDIRGNIVKTINSGDKVAGWYETNWNGLDDSGNTVNTGIYFCRLQVGAPARGDYGRTIKMVYLK